MKTDQNSSDRAAMRVLFAGGTTGGHLMPGAAVAHALRRLLPGSRAMFLLTGHRAESRCRNAIAGFESVRVPPTPWAGVTDKALFPLKALRAAERTLRVMRAFRPDVVVGLGGHNCVVPVLLGKALGLKTALMESNAVPGRAVGLLAPFADCVFVQWDCAAARLKARRAIASGNPVRDRLFGVDRRRAARRLGLSPHRLTMLALGGSQGALALNTALHRALGEVQAKGVDLQVVHLTGVDHLPGALSRAMTLADYRPIGFLDRMEDAYAVADFVMARAGGSTLAELTALGLPSILIPYPHAAANHQRANAAVLEKARAAITIPQSELSVRRLADTIEVLACNTRLRAQMAAAARRIGRPHAAESVALELARMAGFGGVLSRNLEGEIPRSAARARAA